MIVFAFFIGLLFSIPLGPLGQIMLKRAMEQGFWQGFSIAIMDAVAGFTISLIFLFGAGQLNLDPTLRLIAQIAGLLFLLFIGIKEIFYPAKNKNTEKKVPVSGGRLIENVLMVIGYYISNPTIWIFWISLAGFVYQLQIVEKNSEQYFVFSVLYALGVLACQYLAIMLIRNIKKFDKAKVALKYLSSGAFVITFSYFFYITLIDLSAHWSDVVQIFQ